jgi:starch synthase
LLEKIREALYFYTLPEQWRTLQLNGMAMDNSWEAAAQKYVQLYDEIVVLK